jgi:hypothetical protein
LYDNDLILGPAGNATADSEQTREIDSDFKPKDKDRVTETESCDRTINRESYVTWDEQRENRRDYFFWLGFRMGD